MAWLAAGVATPGSLGGEDATAGRVVERGEGGREARCCATGNIDDTSDRRSRVSAMYPVWTLSGWGIY
jgi:hypothetical protein